MTQRVDVSDISQSADGQLDISAEGTFDRGKFELDVEYASGQEDCGDHFLPAFF